MAQTYTRQSSFSDGDTISASLFNDEYNQLVNAFTYSSSSASSTGHRHDGNAGQGGNIHQIGDLDFLNKIVVDSTNNRWGFYVEVSSSAVEQIRIQDGAIVPVTDNDIDLGTSSLEFKDLFIDGTAHVDTLDVDVNATVAGTLGVTGATTLSSTLAVTGAVTGSSTIQGTTITATTAFVPDASDGAALGTSSLEFSDLFLADGAVINLGTDQDTTLTHVADTGILLNSTRQLQFGDSGTYIHQSADGVLDLVADTEIEINATTVDINGAVDISGNLDVGGNLVVTGTTTFNGGTLTMGDAATDNVVFGADVNSNIIPNTDNTYDLGSSSQEWKDIYIDGTAYLDAINFNGTAITATAAELNIMDGVTATATELNILDGVTSTTAELNILDGVTSSTAELNILDGVTATTSELNILDGVTSTATELNILDGVTATASEINILDGVTSTAAELNLLDGSTANTVVNSKAVVYGSSGEITASSITSNGGVVIDNITIDGTEIDLSSGDLTLDVAGDIILDAGGADVFLKDDGTTFGEFTNSSSDFVIKSSVSDKDIIFKGNDGGSTITALTLDMSAGGAATFNDKIIATELDISGNIDSDGIIDGANFKISGSQGSDGQVLTSTGSGVAWENVSGGGGGGISDVVSDTSPQLGGDLDVNGNDIISTSNGTIDLDPNGSGVVVFKGNATRGAGQFKLNCENNSHGIIIKGPPHSAAASYTLTLPNDDGSSNQVLRTDGSGNLSWIDQLAGVTNITISGELDAGSLDISGDIDVDGTTNLDVVDIDGAVDMASTLTVADDLAVDTDTLFVDASTDRVGIGLTAPSNVLHIKDSNPTIRLEDSDGSGAGIAQVQNTANGNLRLIADPNNDGSSSSSIEFEIDGSEIARFDSSGNLGIGTTSPSQKLHVAGIVQADTGVIFGGSPSYFYESATDNVNLRIGSDGPYIEFIDVGSNGAEIGNSSGFLALTSGGAEKVRIATDGNLGIGDNNPIDKLTVSRLGASWDGVAPNAITGALIHPGVSNSSSASSGTALTIAGNSTASSTIYFSSNTDNDVGEIKYDHDDDSMAVRVNGSERMRIDSSGNTGIGTSSPAYKLDVDSTIHIGNDGGSGFTHSRLIFDSNGSARGTGNFFHNQDNDVEWFAGNAYNKADSFAITRNATASHADATANVTNALMVVNSSGNLGIGDDDPVDRLTVSRLGSSWSGVAPYSGTAMLLHPGGTNAGSGTTLTIAGNSSSTSSIYFSSDTDNDAGQIKYVYSGNAMTFATSGSERMRIDSSGNVGIGTTSPTQKLDVNGTVELNNLTVGGSQGTDGQVLTSTGSGIAWEDASGGGGSSVWNVITDTTISSNVASVAFTSGLSGYRVYKIIFTDVYFSGHPASIELNVSSDAGSSYQTSNWQSIMIHSDDVQSSVSQENDYGTSGGRLPLTKAMHQYNTDQRVMGEITIWNLNNSHWTYVKSTFLNNYFSSRLTFTETYAQLRSTTAFNAFKFTEYNNSQNFSGGHITVYGISD